MFKRRRELSYLEITLRTFWPKGGWARASRYVVHRLRRLPDPAYKISRGIAVGVFTSFTPFFGFHFVVAGLLAWMIRGNMLAALMGTFFGNPLTFPVISALSMEIGTHLLGRRMMPLPELFGAFSRASIELWRNFVAIFSSAETHWASLAQFFDQVFLPYLIGGLVPGIVAGAAAYFLSKPVIAAYQKARVGRMKKRFEKRREAIRSRTVSRPLD